jgi:peptidoglycan L-alanyl-D-glutamate endopeptidase CwlK
MAAKQLGTPIRWGGAWDITFNDSSESPADLVEDYVSRRKRANKKAFVDGPHFELPKTDDP